MVHLIVRSVRNIQNKTGYQNYGLHSTAYNALMLRTLTLLLVFCLSSAFAQIDKGAPAAPVSLAELAAAADLVVLAQAKDTDYLRRRDIPVSGSAYLKVLISYKGATPVDIIEIYEKGLHDQECYFPDPTVFEEGRRYLLFLVRDPEDETRFRGLPQGCALDVLVNDKNRYALRYPVNGIVLSDRLEQLATEMKFSDSYALANDADLLPAERDSMRSAGDIVAQASGQWLYTRGVSLSHVRGLMGKKNLSD
jgi:hypothetical protein